MTSATTTGTATGLLTDNVTVASIRDFLSNETKPEYLEPVDIIHVIYLMARKAEDHGIIDSKLTLSKRFNCSPSTVVRSRERLQKAGYIGVERRRGRTNSTAINVENLPAEATLRSKITPEAERLAERYCAGLIKLGKKKFSKYFKSNQIPTAQRVLDSCQGDIVLATNLIDHALDNPTHSKKAKKSLYELFGRWSKVQQTYADANPPTTAPAKRTSVGESPTSEETAPDHQTDPQKFAQGMVRFVGDATPEALPEWTAMFERLLQRQTLETVQMVFRLNLTMDPAGSRYRGWVEFERLFDQMVMLARTRQRQEAA